MSYEDYEKGLRGIGHGTSQDYLKGVKERVRNQAEPKPTPPRETPPYTAPYQPPKPVARSPGALPGPARSTARPTSDTLHSMTKSGAALLLVLFVVYTLLTNAAWTWPQMIAGAAIAAVLGAVAGAVLYIAIRLLAVVLRIAGVLLLAGVALHLFGVLNLPAVLSRIAGALGL